MDGKTVHKSNYMYAGTIEDTDYFIASCSCGWISGSEYEDGIRSKIAAQNSWRRHVSSWFDNSTPSKSLQERKEIALENTTEEPKLPFWYQDGPPDLHDPNKEYVPSNNWGEVFTTPISIASVKIAGISKQKLDIPLSSHVQKAIDDFNQAGHKPLVVGGAVRDAMLGKDPKDVDFEVHSNSGLNYDDMVSILSKHGKVDVVGKQFAVAKFTDPEGNEYDFALPRRDSSTGIHHKDYQITTDHTMTPEEATKRRDFTINAMMYDPSSEELHDYHGGQEDLKNKHIRIVDPETHSEDHLRQLRAARFAAQLGFTLHPDTAKYYRENHSEEGYNALPTERIAGEWDKIFASPKPSAGIKAMHEMGLLKHYPTITENIGVPQHRDYHKEKDVFEHICQAADAAAAMEIENGSSTNDRIRRVKIAFGHDMGKGRATKQDDNGHWIAHGHEDVTADVASQFYRQIGTPEHEIKAISNVIKCHMRDYDEGTRPRAIRKLIKDIHPANFGDWVTATKADKQARVEPGGKANPLSMTPKSTQRAIDLFDENKIEPTPQPGLLRGQDLLDRGWQPGKEVGQILHQAQTLEDAGHFDDESGNPSKDLAHAWLDKQIPTKQSSWKNARSPERKKLVQKMKTNQSLIDAYGDNTETLYKFEDGSRVVKPTTWGDIDRLGTLTKTCLQYNGKNENYWSDYWPESEGLGQMKMTDRLPKPCKLCGGSGKLVSKVDYNDPEWRLSAEPKIWENIGQCAKCQGGHRQPHSVRALVDANNIPHAVWDELESTQNGRYVNEPVGVTNLAPSEDHLTKLDEYMEKTGIESAQLPGPNFGERGRYKLADWFRKKWTRLPNKAAAPIQVRWKKKWKRIKKVRNMPSNNKCQGCGRAINYIGLCGTCRENLGFVRHHWWSEHSQQGKT